VKTSVRYANGIWCISRVRTDPGKSWNLIVEISRPRRSWKKAYMQPVFEKGMYPGKSLKTSFLSPGKPWNLVFTSPGKRYCNVCTNPVFQAGTSHLVGTFLVTYFSWKWCILMHFGTGLIL